MTEILIADDSKLARRRIKDILSNFDFEHTIVNESENGQEAVLNFARKECDLIFMDIEMPKLNGIEAIKKIKAISPYVHIIIVSSVINKTITSINKEYKNIQIVQKPIKAENIKKHIDSFLSTKI